MTKGFVNQEEVDRFLCQYHMWQPKVQQEFKELFDLYSAGNVTYDNNMSFSRFNLRYVSHPTTNLSEGNAMNFLVKELGDDTHIEMVTTLSEQMKGYDLLVNDETSISVKLASIPVSTTFRSFSIHKAVRDAITQKDQSDFVIFVDNITNLAIMYPRPLLSENLTKCTACAHKVRVFFDVIKTTRQKVVKSTI